MGLNQQAETKLAVDLMAEHRDSKELTSIGQQIEILEN